MGMMISSYDAGLPELYISGKPNLREEIVGNTVAKTFTVSLTSTISDKPTSAIGGFALSGVFFPMSNTDKNFAVFAWQIRDTNGDTREKLWYRYIKDSYWNGPWKLVTATDD